MGNTNFDTNRFIETSTTRQLNNGTLMFMDTFNPGVYYSANRNGTINRITDKYAVNFKQVVCFFLWEFIII